ncbi:MAG: hypothetical protein IH624_00155 [Phycisphaerae bacterium]|nr:hypothetical protein [Phycisphaerae bacterium]
MDNRTLVTDPEMRGRYVAVVSANDNTVITSGTNRKEVKKRALSQGFALPLIVFVPQGHRTHCIHAH